jgi:hypothetical protein
MPHASDSNPRAAPSGKRNRAARWVAEPLLSRIRPNASARVALYGSQPSGVRSPAPPYHLAAGVRLGRLTGSLGSLLLVPFWFQRRVTEGDAG